MEKENKNLLKRIVKVSKKISDAEGNKNRERKRDKKNLPKGMFARRMGAFVFWLLFTFMFLVTTVNIFGNSSDAVADEFDEENSKLYENEGVEFAKEFLKEYFTWSIDKHGREKRIHLLEPYLIAGLDSQGGVKYDSDWASSIDKRDIILKEIQKINDEKARFIFKVKITLKMKTEEKDTKYKPDELNFEEYLQEERKAKVINGVKTKVSEKYISVPVYFDKDEDEFAVFELPSFTYLKEGKVENYLASDLEQLSVLSDGYVENNVKAFLDTFFTSYSKDGKDKLNYIIEDERHQNGLNGTMSFINIKDTKIYKVDDNSNRFIIDTKVILADPSTKLEFTNKYLVVIKRKDQRYVVESLNDEKFVNEIVKEYVGSLEDEISSEDEEEIQDVEFNYQGELMPDEYDED